MGLMPSFGEMLRQERKTRNIRVRDVAESTKISSIYLRALEANDFSQLPGKVFNKGYVRAYAEFLGADADHLVSAYEKEERAQGGGPENQDQAAPRPGKGPATFWLTLAVSAAVILALGAVGIAGWLSRNDEGPEPSGPAGPQRASISTVARAPDESAVTESAAEPGPDTSATRETVPPTAEPSDPRPRPREELPSPSAAEEDPQPASSPVRQVPPPPTPVAPPSDRTSGLTVTEHALGGRVENHRIQDEGEMFEEGARVYFWTRVVGAEPGQILRHVWIRDGAMVSSVDLKLGSSNWRAHTYKTMYPGSTGQWTVEARDGQDRLLASRSFTCGP